MTIKVSDRKLKQIERRATRGAEYTEQVIVRVGRVSSYCEPKGDGWLCGACGVGILPEPVKRGHKCTVCGADVHGVTKGVDQDLMNDMRSDLIDQAVGVGD